MISKLLFSLAATAVSAYPAVSTTLPFDISVFEHAAAACQNTYCGAALNNVGRVFGDMTLLESVPLAMDEQRANVYLSESQGIILAYQGTNLTSIDSIIHDAELWHTFPRAELGLPPQARVFFGFQDQWYKSWSNVAAALTRALQENPGHKVLVTGHSMGASMAQLAALAINKQFGDIISYVIPLEPPRTGNHFFRDEFDKVFKGRYSGVVNGDDWVPHVMPMALDYFHPSGLVWIYPANSSNYMWFPTSEDPRGPNSKVPELLDIDAVLAGDWNNLIYWGDHQGQLFGVGVETVLGNCPVNVTGSAVGVSADTVSTW